MDIREEMKKALANRKPKPEGPVDKSYIGKDWNDLKFWVVVSKVEGEDQSNVLALFANGEGEGEIEAKKWAKQIELEDLYVSEIEIPEISHSVNCEFWGS